MSKTATKLPQNDVPLTEDEIVTLVKAMIEQNDYGEAISELEDQFLSLSAALHELKEEVAEIWKEFE